MVQQFADKYEYFLYATLHQESTGGGNRCLLKP
jgi:hypothetical protein